MASIDIYSVDIVCPLVIAMWVRCIFFGGIVTRDLVYLFKKSFCKFVHLEAVLDGLLYCSCFVVMTPWLQLICTIMNCV